MSKINSPMWQNQIAGLKMAETCPDLYIAFEMGTGKTRTTIEILRRLYSKHGSLKRTLILCPAIVVSNWKNEITTFSRIAPEDILLLRGTAKDRERYLMKSTEEGGVMSKPKIVVTNYHALQMKELVKLLEQWQPEVLVCDEAHELKNHSSKRAQALLPLAKKAKNRYLLSGTPTLNQIDDIFMQYRILDGGQTFGENYYVFRNSYMKDLNSGMREGANKDKYFGKWRTNESAFQEYQEKLHRKMIVCKKSDVLDLPPLVKLQVEAEMSPMQAKMYKEMKRDFITWVQSQKNSGQAQAVIATLAITKALRLQQIVSGYATTDTGEVVHMDTVPRLDALEEVLTPLVPVHKVIVWCVFKENYRMISKRLEKMGVQFQCLTGEQTMLEKDEAMKDFRSNPETRVMIANQAAGGVGVNLIEASYSVYYSKNFSLKDDLQSEARNYRGGSEMHDKVTRIDIVSPGTIDELISESLAGKQEIAEKVLDRSFLDRL